MSGKCNHDTRNIKHIQTDLDTRIYNALKVLFAFELQTCFETFKRSLEPQTPNHHLNQYVVLVYFDTPKILST